MPETIWGSRPADLYGRRSRDRVGVALMGVRLIFEGFAAVSRWDPVRVKPVRRIHPAVVTKRELVAPDVVALTLADPDGGLLPSWTPGGHIDVMLPSGRRRQYSLCGLPGRRTDYRIAIRRIAAGGGGSIEMHEAFGVGDALTFEGPRNAFSPGTYPGTAERDVLFVIGGIGVTPILPMIRTAQQRGTYWRAVYAGRSREFMPLLDEVVAVAPEKVTVWADDEHGGPATVDDLLAAAGPRTAVCVCGPAGMLDAVRAARNEFRAAPLHFERFSPAPVVDGVPFELELARSRQALRVPGNRSALDVMRDQEPTTPYSCRQGFCGTCKVKVLAGQVDHRGRLAVEDGEMLVCVSRARGDRLVIDV